MNSSDESAIDIIDHQVPLLIPKHGSETAPLHFLRRLRRLVDELQPYQALYLAGLSILESIIVARGTLHDILGRHGYSIAMEEHLTQNKICKSYRPANIKTVFIFLF
jgi:hypothetical protein